MGTNWKTGGETPSGSASIALPGQKLVISKNPRMLTPSELDLLRQDLKSALEVVGQDEIDSLESLLREQGFQVSDFKFLRNINPSDARPPGTVLVRRTSDGVEKPYAATSAASWLARFEADLKAGTFGSPPVGMAVGRHRIVGEAGICEAIRRRALIEFRYHGRLRVVAPYCHGISTRGVQVLRAIQVRGLSASGGLGFGKLWAVSEMVDPYMLDETFQPNDPKYNPNDAAMKLVHCRI
jgi:hypothetical protein